MSRSIQADISKRVRFYTINKSTSSVWEVWSSICDTNDQSTRSYVVNLDGKSCDCCRWRTNRIPCAHALAAILAQCQDPYDYVEKCFTSEAYRATYALPILPIADHSEWMPQDSDIDSDKDAVVAVLPPDTWRPLGRPKKRRIHTAKERNDEDNA